MRRSVTAELELEEGEYHLLMKVEAQKRGGALPVENVVRNNAKDRRDKLVRIGLAYDLAHAKGQFKESDEEKKLKKKFEADKKAKERREVKEKLMKEKKKRKHNENKERRKERAAAAKRKAKEKAKAARNAEKEKQKKKSEEGDLTQPKEDAAVVKPNEATEVKEPVAVNTTAETPSKPLDATTSEKSAEKVDSGIVAVENKDAQSSVDLEKVAEKATEEEKVPPTSSKETPASETVTATAPGEASQSSEKEPGKEANILVAPEIKINGSAPPSEAGFSDTDEDDLSDIESVVSDISSGEIDDVLEDQKLAAQNALPPMPQDDEEDEFQKDPWNAVAVVGLRVYAKGGGVSIKLVRPPPNLDLGGEKKEGVKAENKLDVDDSAVDATKGINVTAPAPGQMPQGSELTHNSSTKGDAESEGSGILV